MTAPFDYLDMSILAPSMRYDCVTLHKKYVVLEGKGQPESKPIPLLHKDNRKAYEDACDVCKWHYRNKEARTLYVTDGTYISPTAIKRMRELP